jgi:tyrosyl-tRNA synthetase
VHGPAQTSAVVEASRALFGQAPLDAVEEDVLAAALRETTTVPMREGATFAELFEATGLVQSRGAARRTAAEGGAYVNNQRVHDPDAVPGPSDLLHGRWMVLRRGKRAVAGVERVPAGRDSGP